MAADDVTMLDVKQALAGGVPGGGRVEVRGWVRTRRDSKAGLSFVALSDGSCFAPLQVVAPASLPNYAEEVQRLSAGCAIVAEGTLVPSQGKGQAFELQAERIEVVVCRPIPDGWADPDRIDQIMIPKVGCAADIYAVDALVTAIEAAKGRKKKIAFEVIIESAAGIAHVEEIAASSPRLQAMSLGAADFAASMGMAPRYGRSLVMASNESTTVRMRPNSGMYSPERPFG